MVVSTIPLDLPERIKRVRNEMRAEGFEALLVTSRAMKRYLVGHKVPAALVLINENNVSAYVESGKDSIFPPSVVGPPITIHRSKDPLRDCSAAISSQTLIGTAVVGFESESMTYADHSRLFHLLPRTAKLREADYLLRAIRSQLDLPEIARVESAIDIVRTALDDATTRVHEASEAELASIVDDKLADFDALEQLRKGETPQIRTYVAYGPHAADPTHRPTSSRLEGNQLAVMSAGASVDGYWAVESRTVGKTNDPQLLAAQSLVDKLYEWTRLMLLAGQSIRSVSEQSLLLLREAGISNLAPHPPCFSMGMELAEPILDDPAIAPVRIVCMEPGLYIAQKGGVRLGTTEIFRGPQDTEPHFDQSGSEALRGLRPFFPDLVVDSAAIDRHAALLIGDNAHPWGGGQ